MKPDNPPAIIDDDIHEPPSKTDLFIRNLFLYDNVQQAAIEAGYSKTTASGTIYKVLKSKKMQERIRQYAITHELINIPKILRLEHQALEYLDGKPQELPKFAAILKQKKQIAGLLQQDAPPQQPTISIESVQNLMLNVSSNPVSTPGNVQQTHKPLITHNKAE